MVKMGAIGLLSPQVLKSDSTKAMIYGAEKRLYNTTQRINLHDDTFSALYCTEGARREAFIVAARTACKGHTIPTHV
jgi:predicted nucleic acid-binding protein